MIDDKYREASEKTSDAIYNAHSLIVAAWHLATEMDGNGDRRCHALIGLLNIAEDKLEEATNAHMGEWVAMGGKA